MKQGVEFSMGGMGHSRNAALGPVCKRTVDSINLCMSEYADDGARLLLSEMREVKAHVLRARVLTSVGTDFSQ